MIRLDAQPRGQRRHVRRIVTAVGLFVLCATFVALSIRVPAPVPASASATRFSAERALRHVRVIAQRPHPTGSEDNARVRAYLVTELTSLGLAPQVQEATGVGTRHRVAGRAGNVLARMPGVRPNGQAVLFMAHYDGVGGSPAAGDDASGSAVLLETLRTLRAGTPLAHDVIALFTDGEEPGMIGAAAFVREHPWANDVGVILNFEARGTRGRSLMFETGPGSLEVVRVLRTVPDVSATSLLTAGASQLPNDTDLSELAVLERPALNFAFVAGADRYHTAEDDVAHLSPGSVQHHGNLAVALARAFGNGPLPRPRTSDAVFFDVPLLGIIAYPESWALPLGLVTGLLVLVALVRLRGSERRWLVGLILGAVGCAVATVAAAAAGFGAALVLQRLHARLPGGGSPEWSGAYATAVAILAFAIAASSYAVVRRWAGATGAHVGALAVWATLATLCAYAEPGVSFLFTWPLLAGTAAALARAARAHWITPTLVWVATLVASAVLVPTLYLAVCITLGIGQWGSVVMAGLVAFAAWLLAPQLESLAGERRWSTPAYATGAAAGLFAFGLATVRTDLEHPVSSSLVYAVDSDSGTAWLTGRGETGLSGAWLREALEPSSQMLSASNAASPAWLARSYGFTRAAPAPLAAVGAPVATVLADSSVNGERRVTLHVTAARGTLEVRMSADTGIVRVVAVAGRKVDTSRYRNPTTARRFLTYAAPSDSGFTVLLTVPASTHPALELVAMMPGIPPLPDVRIPPRPPGVLPTQCGDCTLVYRRLRL